MLRILTRPWSEDSSTPIGKNNRKTDREEQRERQTKQATTRKGQQHNTQPNKTKKGGERGGQVLKNLTRLWPGSSSTQSANLKDQIKYPGHWDLGAMAKLGSAHVVSERGESGGGSRKKKLEALTVFSQRIQAREREKRRMGEEVKGGAGNPGREGEAGWSEMSNDGYYRGMWSLCTKDQYVLCWMEKKL